MVGAYLHSFILAKTLGLYMIVMAIVMITRPEYYKGVMQDIQKEKLATLSGASFSLIFGVFLLCIHNLWAFEPYVVVTIVAWIIVIKSVLWLAVPEKMANMFRELYSGKTYYVFAVIVGISGMWILSYGVFLFGGPFPLSIDLLN